MRYIRKEKIITTICNENVEDGDKIKELLINLKKHMVEFSLGVQKMFPSLGDYKNLCYNKVKVKQVEGNTVDFIVFDKSSTTHLRNIGFEDIVEIKAITTIDKILKVEPDCTRWDLLDIKEV